MHITNVTRAAACTLRMITSIDQVSNHAKLCLRAMVANILLKISLPNINKMNKNKYCEKACFHSSPRYVCICSWSVFGNGRLG